MAIDTSTLEATLQTKFDNVTDPKEMLLLGKAYEATVGGIAVSDIEDAGAAQVATINSVATSTFKTVGGESILGSGDIVTSAGLKSQQVFTSSGTWTKPAGITLVKVIVTGGGGGGTTGVENDGPGATGGAGGTAIKIIDVSSVSSVSVTVGSGGSALSGINTTNGQAGNGGTSSFGSYCTGVGGMGGRVSDDTNRGGAIGGNATGGDINIWGGNGMAGQHDTSIANAAGTVGGASYWGGGGAGGPDNNTSFPTYAGVSADYAGAGRAYGSGGAGDFGNTNAVARPGAGGVVVVEEYA